MRVVAKAPAENSYKISSRGITEIRGFFGKVLVDAKIEAHEIDIGPPSTEMPKENRTNCTYSRFPCSTVDDLDIKVNGNEISVARSVFGDLGDISSALLSRKTKDQFLLILGGGDASKSFSVEILFTNRRVLERDIRLNEADYVIERTVYFPPAEM